MDLIKVKSVLEQYEKEILKLPGVIGVSIGIIQTKSSLFCIKVYLSKPIDRGDLNAKKLPIVLEGVQIEVKISGSIVAFEK